MKRVITLLSLAALLLASCNVPGSGAPSPDVATAAALTVQAALESNQTSQSTPTADAGNGTTQASNDSGKPFASFEDVTNCRTGPGVNYERITQIQPGFAVEIIGFYPPNYWIVQTDQGPCWVAGEFVTPSGAISGVPTVTAPPTPTGAPPQKVSLQRWDITCDYVTNQAQVSISWVDRDDEDGYRVVRNDTVIAELSPNVTEFKETISLLSGQTVGYSIIIFNASGTESSQTITLAC